jgi:hypothetical protein
MSVNDIAERFAENKRRVQVENEVLLLKHSLLNEGLRRLREAAEPLAELGLNIEVDTYLHRLTIKAQVTTDGRKWLYEDYK